MPTQTPLTSTPREQALVSQLVRVTKALHRCLGHTEHPDQCMDPECVETRRVILAPAG
jgi:hypothetical protein